MPKKFDIRHIKNVNIVHAVIVVLIISTFFLSTFVRGIFFENGLKSINVLAVMAILFLLIKSFMDKGFLNKEKINCLFDDKSSYKGKLICLANNNFSKTQKVVYALFVLLSLIFLISEIMSKSEINTIIVYYACIIFPLLLLTIEWETDEFKKIFDLFINIFNVFILLLLIIGIIDFFTDKSIGRFLEPIINDSTYSRFINSPENRYFSFVGHPLVNSELFILFYIINNLYNKYFGTKVYFPILTIIATAGVALTGSKTGLVVLLVCMFVFAYKKLVYWMFIIGAGITAYFLGIFDMTIERFKSGSLTSGRAENWEVVQNANLYPLEFFNGYGSDFIFDYNLILPGASAAFEYPFLGLTLHYGFLFCILFYIILFIIPGLVFLKRKQYLILISYVLIAAVVNTFNGLYLPVNALLILAVVVFYLNNLSKYVFELERKGSLR